MYENNTLSSSQILDQYEAVDTLLPTGSFYENDILLSSCASFESNLSSQTNNTSLTPLFQQKLPILFVVTLGCFEILGGIAVLVLEILIFDIAIGLWCGVIYSFAGLITILFVITTDRERHQTSIVLIVQFIAFMFTITEIALHTDFYRKRCRNESTAPIRETSYQCQFFLFQIGGACLVLLSTIMFALVYCRVTMIVLKQPHGTCNLSNAMHLTCY